MAGYRGMSTQLQQMIRAIMSKSEEDRKRKYAAEDRAIAAAGPYKNEYSESERITQAREDARGDALSAKVDAWRTRKYDESALDDVAKGRSRAEDAIPYLSDSGRSALTGMMNLGGVSGGVEIGKGGRYSGALSAKDVMGSRKDALELGIKERGMMNELSLGAAPGGAEAPPPDLYERANEHYKYLNRDLGDVGTAPAQTTEDFQQSAREHQAEQQFMYRNAGRSTNPAAPRKIMSIPGPATGAPALPQVTQSTQAARSSLPPARQALGQPNRTPPIDRAGLLNAVKNPYLDKGVPTRNPQDAFYGKQDNAGGDSILTSMQRFAGQTQNEAAPKFGEDMLMFELRKSGASKDLGELKRMKKNLLKRFPDMDENKILEMVKRSSMK